MENSFSSITLQMPLFFAFIIGLTYCWMSILCPLKIKKEPIYLTFHKIVSRSTTAPADFCLHQTPMLSLLWMKFLLWHLRVTLTDYRQISRSKATPFYGCSLCIYVEMLRTVIRLLFVMQHHLHQHALYAVSVRRLPCLPTASFRFAVDCDALTFG